MVADGLFRKDLYHRINLFPITLPPLRERKEDVPLLAEHFLEIFRQDFGRQLPGISPEAIHNIFNPYYTTKARGTGLGLSITHRIIKAHKGRIEVRNREGGGAVFIIKLPYPLPENGKA